MTFGYGITMQFQIRKQMKMHVFDFSKICGLQWLQRHSDCKRLLLVGWGWLLEKYSKIAFFGLTGSCLMAVYFQWIVETARKLPTITAKIMIVHAMITKLLYMALWDGKYYQKIISKKCSLIFWVWVLSGVRAPPVYSCVSLINSNKCPKIACNDCKMTVKSSFWMGKIVQKV